MIEGIGKWDLSRKQVVMFRRLIRMHTKDESAMKLKTGQQIYDYLVANNVPTATVLYWLFADRFNMHMPIANKITGQKLPFWDNDTKMPGNHANAQNPAYRRT